MDDFDYSDFLVPATVDAVRVIMNKSTVDADGKTTQAFTSTAAAIGLPDPDQPTTDECAQSMAVESVRIEALNVKRQLTDLQRVLRESEPTEEWKATRYMAYASVDNALKVLKVAELRAGLLTMPLSRRYVFGLQRMLSAICNSNSIKVAAFTSTMQSLQEDLHAHR